MVDGEFARYAAVVQALFWLAMVGILVIGAGLLALAWEGLKYLWRR